MKLQDLYYGNVIPCQHDVRKDSDYAKRSLELLEMCDTLEKRLSADDKKLLNDITDMQGMLSETMAAESYIQGFRDCTELIIDVMWNCQEMCSRRIPKILDRQESGSVVSQPS